MKIVKRALSVFLAFLMIFSSVSLLASAELGDGKNASAVFYTKYYRNAGTQDSPNWVPTDAIKRGEQVKARIFIETDYEVGVSQVFWLYNKNFMTLNTDGYTKSGVRYDLSHIVNTSANSVTARNNWSGSFTTADEPGGTGTNDAAYWLDMDGYIDPSVYDEYAWVAIQIDNGDPAETLTIGEGENKFGDDYFIFDLTFDVIETPDSGVDEGMFYMPAEAIQDSQDGAWAYSFLGKSLDGTDFSTTEGWDTEAWGYEYDLGIEDTKLPISTKSKVILNAGEDGYYGLGENKVPDTEASSDKDKDDVKTAFVAAEIGSAVAVPTNLPTPYSATKVFEGWALADDKDQKVLTDEEITALKYGYNNIELNAVYAAAGASYKLVVVEQKADGNWPTAEEIAAITPVENASSDGAVIKASDYVASAGFYVENTADTITVSATETKTLTVRLARKAVAVTFDGANAINGIYGATVTAPVKDVADGYTNTGWYAVDAEGGKTLVAKEGAQFTLPAADTNYVSDVTADKQDVTVKVVYEGKTVAVTYEDITVTGGKVQIAETAGSEADVTYILLSDIAAKALAAEPALKNYSYDADGSNTLYGEATATGLELKVAYAANEYDVTFDTAIDSIADINLKVAYGETVAADKLPTTEAMQAANPGYTFNGWFNGDDEFVPGTTVIEGPVTYKAKFTANEVKIYFEYLGADIPADAESQLPETERPAIYGNTFELPAVKVPAGYELTWTVEGATKNAQGKYVVGTTDVMVTGEWSLKEYTLTYYYWDGKVESDIMKEVTLTYKDKIPAEVAEMPGYQFEEWMFYNDEIEDPEPEIYTTMPAHNVYAVATLKPITYTVQFVKYDLYEADFVELDTISDAYQGMILPAQVPATGLPANYNFLGWVDADGNDVDFALIFDFKEDGEYVVIPEDSTWTYDEASATAILEVYADYQIPVEFDSDGGVMIVDGEETDIATVYARYNEAIEKDANNWGIAKEGYTFDGWEPYFEDGMTPEESSYFLALWLPNIYYEFAGTVPAGVTAPPTVYGAEIDSVIDVPVKEAAGYSYTVSYSEDAVDNGDGTYSIYDAPVTVTYNWTADGNVKYTVKTYLENAGVTAEEFDADNYTFKEEVERTGTTGAAITFAEELYDGFKFEKLQPADATIGGDGLTVVSAYYSRNTVKVTVKDDKGNEITDDNGDPIVPPTAETGDEIEQPTYKPDTDEPGKEFDKWVDEEGKDVKWPITVDGEGDIVIKPVFKYTDYTITYVTAGDAPAGFELPNATYKNGTVNYGNDINVPDWNNDTVPGYNVTVTVAGAGADGKVGEGNVTVTATWSKDIFTVKYVTVGTAPAGYNFPADVDNATIGTKVSVPDWAAPAGYALELKVDGAKRLDNGSYEVYNDNVTVTATWTALESTYIIHTFVMDLDGNYDEANPAVSSGTGTTGLEATYTAPVKEGFKADKETYKVVVTNDDTDIIKVYYSRNKNNLKYTIGDKVVNTVPTYYGATVDTAYQPADEAIPAGKDFLGWSTDANATQPDTQAIVMGDAETALYAVLKDTDYTITYVTEGTAPAGYELPNATYANGTVHYGDEIKVPAWNNDTVAGYNVEITVSGAGADGKVGEDNVVVTAEWTYDAFTLTYSFDASAPAGATVPAAEDIYVGKNVTLATPAAVSGYTFAGWVIDGKTYAAGATFTAGAADAAAVGSWTANEGVTYFVRRHFEVLGQDGVYGAEETLIRKTGKAGDPATYSETVTGFTLDHILPENATIGGDGETIIDVYYTRNTVNVTIKNQDGSVNEALSGEYEYGATISEPKAPVSTDEGKSFDEWQYKDGTPVTWPITINSETPIEIVPKFYNNTYLVRFLISDGNVYSDIPDAEYSTTISEPEDDPKQAGCTFIEWRRGSVDGPAWTAEDTVPVGGVDYYAYFKADSNIAYTITKYFQNVTLDGIDYSLTETINGNDATTGEKMTLDLEALAVEGFKIDKDNSTYELVINGNGKNAFVINYLRNTTTIVVDGVEESVIFGEEITEEEAEKIIKDNGTYDEGYEYTGWVDEDNNPVTFPYVVPAVGGKLTPVYTLKSFTVRFVDEDGNEVKKETVEYKSALANVAPEYPEKDGYIATGWYNAEDGTAMPATMPAKDVTYEVGYTYATNTPYTIKIFIMDLNGSYDTIITSVKNYGTTGEIARVEPVVMTGLYEDATHPDRLLSAKIEANGSTELRIYYARTKYTVTYDGGEPIEVYYGAAIPAPTAAPTAPGKGKEFVNWTDKDGNEPKYYAAMPEKNLAFTSNWTDADFTITYVVNGTQTSETYKYNEVINAKADPVVPGMQFEYWVDAEGNKGIPATMPEKDIILVAQFSTAFFKVTFLDDENGNVFEEITVLCGATITLPQNNPTKANHKFIEWVNVPETMPAENLVIIPKFERIPVELVAMDGSTTQIDPETKIITGLKAGLNETILREQFLKVNGDGYMVITPNKKGYGTGATVELYDNVLGLVATYTIVVFGDIDGDSRINTTDFSMISSEINYADISRLWSIEGLETYDMYKVMAANINGDGRIDTTDAGAINNATLGSIRIDQVTRTLIYPEA